jgi:hypothetical protein
LKREEAPEGECYSSARARYLWSAAAAAWSPAPDPAPAESPPVRRRLCSVTGSGASSSCPMVSATQHNATQHDGGTRPQQRRVRALAKEVHASWVRSWPLRLLPENRKRCQHWERSIMLSGCGVGVGVGAEQNSKTTGTRVVGGGGGCKRAPTLFLGGRRGRQLPGWLGALGLGGGLDGDTGPRGGWGWWRGVASSTWQTTITTRQVRHRVQDAHTRPQGNHGARRL